MKVSQTRTISEELGLFFMSGLLLLLTAGLLLAAISVHATPLLPEVAVVDVTEF